LRFQRRKQDKKRLAAEEKILRMMDLT